MNLINYDYKGSQISFMSGDNVMVNATEMANSFGKRVRQWFDNPGTHEFVEVLAQARGITPMAEKRTSLNTSALSERFPQLIKVIKGGTPGTVKQGTWFHEDVALEFARWLSPQFAIWCNDRIKELMKYGITATPQTIDNILADPDNAIKILMALKEERKKNKLLEDQNHVYQSEHRRLVRIQHEQVELLEAQAPKVEYADNILNSATTYTTTQIAKELGLSAQHLNFTLKSHGVIEKKGGIWTATETYTGKGYLTVKSYPYLN